MPARNMTLKIKGRVWLWVEQGEIFDIGDQEKPFWGRNIQTDTKRKSQSKQYFTQVASQFSRLLFLRDIELWWQGQEEDAHWQVKV